MDFVNMLGSGSVQDITPLDFRERGPVPSCESVIAFIYFDDDACVLRAY